MIVYVHLILTLLYLYYNYLIPEEPVYTPRRYRDIVERTKKCNRYSQVLVFEDTGPSPQKK